MKCNAHSVEEQKKHYKTRNGHHVFIHPSRHAGKL